MLITELRTALKRRSLEALTPYIPSAWEQSLVEADLISKYPLIPSGLRRGFHTSLSNLTQSYFPPNSLSIEEHRSIFNDIINKEISKGRYIGPLNRESLESLIGPFQTALLSLVPKPGKPGKFRLVQNLSFPYKSTSPLLSSPNSRVDLDQFPTYYSTFQITSTIISSLPPGSQAAVRDVAEAYRTVPSHPSQWPSLVVRLGSNQFVVDTSFCFGFAPSGGIYGQIGAAGVNIMRHRGMGPIARWVDDHLFFRVKREFLDSYNQIRALGAERIGKFGGPVTKGGRTWFAGSALPNGEIEEFDEEMRFPLKDLSLSSPRSVEDSTFCYNFSDIDHISGFLGIPWESLKDIPFADLTTFIGFIWDLTSRTVTLTEAKQQKYLTTISEWERRRTHTLEDVQKLHGKLLHASLIFPPGRAYLTNLESMLSIFGDNPFKPRTPPRDTPDDLKWWRATLSPLPLPTIPIPTQHPILDFHAFSDASSSVGIAIVIGNRWRAWSLVGNWKRDGCDIAWAESITFKLLVQTIIDAGASSVHLKIFGDNVGVVEGWANGRSRNKQVNQSFRRIHSMLQIAWCQVVTCYVPSGNNPADRPSRGISPPLHHLLPEVRIPDELQPFLQNPFDDSSEACQPLALDRPSDVTLLEHNSECLAGHASA